MRRPFIRQAALIAGLSLALVASTASAAVTDFRGAWINADPATRGISQIAIRSDGGQLVVHVWGRCHPNDCDWGEVPAQLFTPNVGVPVDAGADEAIVQFDQAGIQTLIILKAADGALSYQAFTIFAAPGRSNYHQSGRMNRR